MNIAFLQIYFNILKKPTQKNPNANPNIIIIVYEHSLILYNLIYSKKPIYN